MEWVNESAVANMDLGQLKKLKPISIHEGLDTFKNRRIFWVNGADVSGLSADGGMEKIILAPRLPCSILEV